MHFQTLPPPSLRPFVGDRFPKRVAMPEMRVDVDASVRDSPVYWFVLLELAKERGDFASAAHAKQELERLGVRITYRRRATVRPERGCAR